MKFHGKNTAPLAVSAIADTCNVVIPTVIYERMRVNALFSVCYSVVPLTDHHHSSRTGFFPSAAILF
jgi:hypothetical protein